MLFTLILTLSFVPNESTDTVSAFHVVATYQQRHDTTLDISIDGEVIRTTDEHPFYVPERGWVEAQDLVVGDVVQAADGTTGTVEAMVVIHEPQVMYNLTVELIANYLVGDGQWVVHNVDELIQLQHEIGWEVFNKQLGGRNILFGQIAIRPNFSRTAGYIIPESIAGSLF